MYGTKFCIGIIGGANVSDGEQIRIFKETGFDAVFAGWNKHLFDCKRAADKNGMMMHFVHGPFGNMPEVWAGGELGDKYTDQLIRCIEDTAAIDCRIVVLHPHCFVEKEHNVTEAGINNFHKVAERAAQLGVKIAFENVEHTEYLDALMDSFAGDGTVGFCWDTGHELCFTPNTDHIAKYGDRLLCVHLNDNLGVKRFDGQTAWSDDIHLLPFDGIRDWKSAMDSLNACGYNGILTLEVGKNSRDDRHDNDKYSRMPFYEYVAECYNRACRLAYMKNGMKGMSND